MEKKLRTNPQGNGNIREEKQVIFFAQDAAQDLTFIELRMEKNILFPKVNADLIKIRRLSKYTCPCILLPNTQGAKVFSGSTVSLFDQFEPPSVKILQQSAGRRVGFFLG